MARYLIFTRQLEVLVNKTMSPQARSVAVARVARKAADEAQAHNARVLGKAPKRTDYVDGRQGASFETVNPEHGVILTHFDVFNDAVDWVFQALVEHSPVLTGRYRASHRLFADGVEVDAPDPRLSAQTWVFVSTLPYSRKIEAGQSPQAPDGVYEAVATLAAAKFGNVARIRFSFEGVVGAAEAKAASSKRSSAKADRFPAIKIELR